MLQTTTEGQQSQMAQNIVILKIKLSSEENHLLKLERPISPENQSVSRPRPYRLFTDVRRSLRIIMAEVIKEQRCSQNILSDDLCSKKNVVTNDHKTSA